MKYSKIKKAIDASCRADVETILECSNGEGLLESILSAGEEDDIDTACKLLNSKDGEEILVAALDLSIQISDIDRGASWPHTCIDWGQAASDLMMDYGESNHHYFRNM